MRTAEAAWANEVNRRVAELDSGAVQTIPWGGGPPPTRRAPMPQFAVEFHPLAADEAQAAERWYRERNEIASAGSVSGTYQAARASPTTRHARRTESRCSVVSTSIA